ncbi:hypothetical protein JCM9140_310 [Halalkalibacter wakoensis JCM 9140]|uniref:Endolytic transglycosylase MltG n=1 Tax=Halalkalibacter wakoensis JCM 9140 TaxID=1236970 RepID=W4PXD5_9BACI|nr:hypothetical protein [Halalkalibacter wakoensis]GAE24392.1 hypothetical protein JCM9140_310 [Halalkalibacter wakoensis JCM 9140]
MKANSMQSFAGGLLVAAAVCGGVYYFGEKDVAPIQAKEKPATEEMITDLLAENYHVYAEEEWQDILESVAQEAYDDAVANMEPVESEQQEQQTEENIVYHTKLILTVSTGMTSIDVGNALVKADMIENSMSFFNEVERRGVANSLRPGTFEITSEMTLDQIITTIFK